MSKYIQVTDAEIEEIKRDFDEALKNAKLSNGKFTFTRDIGNIDRRATLFFSEKAWIKQNALVDEFSDEVAWHGIAYRGDDEGADDYIIDDIMVYPQEVTGSTVTTDQEKYQNWLYQQEDEVFNNIRMQGHSHVNMGVTPSSVDETLYERILDQLEGDMFYIFMIWNKKGDKTIRIYDFGKNILFETKDVDVEIIGVDIEDFVKESKEQVVKKAYKTGVSTTSNKKSGATDKSGNTGKHSGVESDIWDGYGYYSGRSEWGWSNGKSRKSYWGGR